MSHPEDAEGDGKEMNYHPEVLPKHVDTSQRDRIEDEASDQRNGGERDVGSGIAGRQVARPAYQGPAKRLSGHGGEKA